MLAGKGAMNVLFAAAEMALLVKVGRALRLLELVPERVRVSSE